MTFLTGVASGFMIGCIAAICLTVSNGAVGDRDLLRRYNECVAREEEAQALLGSALYLGRLVEERVLKDEGTL